jgi:dTDP-4-dehydrorhamnose reductase
MRPTLVTVLSGTVAPALRAALDRPVVGWDRTSASPDDPAGVRARLDALDPAAVCHLALGSEAWAAELAAWCARRGRPFLFTSTAMVFDHRPDGPHQPGDERTARDDYGRYKIRCEDLVRAANPGAIVARLGWQIGGASPGNHMLAALRAQAAQGPIRASARWVPATSFLEDTAAALRALLDAGAGGTFHVDGNAESAWDYHRLVLALRARHDPAWRVERHDDHQHDQRLIDPRVRVRSIAERLT